MAGKISKDKRKGKGGQRRTKEEKGGARGRRRGGIDCGVLADHPYSIRGMLKLKGRQRLLTLTSGRNALQSRQCAYPQNPRNGIHHPLNTNPTSGNRMSHGGQLVVMR